MHTLTLLTAPDRRDVSAAALDLLSPAWGPGEVRVLAEGEAVQVPLAATPDAEELAAVQERARGRGHDLVVLPGSPRRHQVLLADMDSTMIGQECIDELADVVGFGERVSAVTARAMAGELDFEAALHERVALLADLPVAQIEQVLDERVTLASGGPTLLATMRAHGAYAALVSGGFTAFTGPVSTALGFDEHRANTLEVAGERLTGRVVPPVVGADAKLTALHEVTAAVGLTPADAICVGDGANDLPMLLAAGTGVALHAKPAVARRCAARVDHGDLTSLLWLQGYTAEDLVHP